jgi:hypothetical protein
MISQTEATIDNAREVSSHIHLLFHLFPHLLGK